MPSNKNIYSLSQVCQSIENAINSHTQGKQFWIKAEISTLNLHQRSGHLYLELVEEKDGEKLAVIRGTIWSRNLMDITTVLGNDKDNILKKGVEIVFLGKITFHKVHGLSVDISEIDLSFNIGELERRKQETIKQLTREGLMVLNKQLIPPTIIQRIALIAAPNTAGLNDFKEHLLTNEHNYKINYTLFEAAVQGINAPASLISALNKIDTSKFDVVALIRGGGSKLDLDSFNNYELCKKLGEFPIPVFTGIGHESDISVADMVAHTMQKTPTALADHFIDRIVAFEKNLYEMYINISRMAQSKIAIQNEKIASFHQILIRDPISKCQLLRGKLHNSVSLMFRLAQQKTQSHKEILQNAKFKMESYCTNRLLNIEPSKINHIKVNFLLGVKNMIAIHNRTLNNHKDSMILLRPDKTLQRGFSITRKDSRAITDVSNLSQGDLIETSLYTGKLISEVKKINKDGQ